MCQSQDTLGYLATGHKRRRIPSGTTQYQIHVNSPQFSVDWELVDHGENVVHGHLVTVLNEKGLSISIFFCCENIKELSPSLRNKRKSRRPRLKSTPDCSRTPSTLSQPTLLSAGRCAINTTRKCLKGLLSGCLS